MTARYDDLVKHYAKHLVVNFEIHSRTDLGIPDDAELPPFDFSDIHEAFNTLTARSLDYDGETIAVQSPLDLIGEDGHEQVVAFDEIKPEDILSARICLAARFHALYAETYSIMSTFAGLERIQRMYPAS